VGRSRCEPSLLLNEQFTAGMGIGFPLILIGSVLAARTGRPARPDDEAVPPGRQPGGTAVADAGQALSSTWPTT
jgi:hypothetical protein